MNFNRKDYERFSESLNCSEEILHAIEIVSGESFETGPAVYRETDEGMEPFDKMIECNAAFYLWENGYTDNLDAEQSAAKILAALPTDDAVEDEEVFWGNDIFAKFDGEKWERA